MSRPWMPMYWGDYLRDTQHLSLEEHGAYLRLIAHYWAHGSLPADHTALKCILGLHGVNGSNRWRSICLAIAPFFDENWRHKRIEAELEKCNTIKEKRAMAGRQGGLISRGKDNIHRFTSQAIAKQKGGIPQRYITSSESGAEEGSAEKKGINPTSELVASMKQKRWV